MLLQMLERGENITDIVFFDTGWEFPQMHAHLDRLEIYRPLTVDPKVARRERFSRQGARTTGLFARRRAGGKSGY